MSYSLQLYTLRNAIQEGLSGTIKKVAQLGFTQVEPITLCPLPGNSARP